MKIFTLVLSTALVVGVGAQSVAAPDDPAQRPTMSFEHRAEAAQRFAPRVRPHCREQSRRHLTCAH